MYRYIPALNVRVIVSTQLYTYHQYYCGEDGKMGHFLGRAFASTDEYLYEYSTQYIGVRYGNFTATVYTCTVLVLSIPAVDQ